MAELTEQVVRIAGAQGGWDDDLRQEFYVKWMESDIPTLPADDAAVSSYINKMYLNLKFNAHSIGARRAELLYDNADEVVRNTAPEQGDDPMDICMAQEEISDRLTALSPLLYDTLVSHAVHGWTAEEIACMDQVSSNTVYQRIHKAKQLVRGELL
jgi:DNA-directed RNA polymerase specialized sigma24 family protein